MNETAHDQDSDETANATTAIAVRVALSALAILMCALALGAVVALVSLFIGIHPCWLMLIGAPSLIVVLRATGSLSVNAAPAVAVVAILLASVYAECLSAVARVAAITGATFAESLRLGGLALTWQVAELGLSPLSILIYAAATVIGVVIATRGTKTLHA